jgi:DNA mismatch endonuclease (patch repair protein)
MGYRFRLHRKDLPGTPDIVLPKYRTVIFVHGCFWHRHSGCKYASSPKTNTAFWEKKFSGNIERDKKNRCKLEEMGFKTLIIWQCETKKIDELRALLVKELPEDKNDGNLH